MTGSSQRSGRSWKPKKSLRMTTFRQFSLQNELFLKILSAMLTYERARHAATDGAFSFEFCTCTAVIKASQLAGKWNGNEGHRFANGSLKLQAPSRFQHHQRGKQSFFLHPSIPHVGPTVTHSLTHAHVHLRTFRPRLVSPLKTASEGAIHKWCHHWG